MSLELMRRVSNLQVESAADLIALALEAGDVRDFALYVAALPCHNQTRKDADFMDSKILQAQPNDKWLPRFQANLWAHYTWVVHVCHPRGHEVIGRVGPPDDQEAESGTCGHRNGITEEGSHDRRSTEGRGCHA